MDGSVRALFRVSWPDALLDGAGFYAAYVAGALVLQGLHGGSLGGQLVGALLGLALRAVLAHRSYTLVEARLLSWRRGRGGTAVLATDITEMAVRRTGVVLRLRDGRRHRLPAPGILWRPLRRSEREQAEGIVAWWREQQRAAAPVPVNGGWAPNRVPPPA